MRKFFMTKQSTNSGIQAMLMALTALLIVCIGLFLRVNDLGKPSLWEDELFSADIIINRPLLPDADTPLFERVHLWKLERSHSFWTVKAADQSPPMYELTAKALLPIFGTSEFGMRITSVLAASVLLIWLGWKAWRNRLNERGPVYLCMLALIAFSGLAVFYAKEARAYSLGLLLISVLTMLFWQRIIDGWRSAPLPRWPEIALCAAAAMTHYNALVITGLIMATYMLESIRRRDWKACARMSTVLLIVIGWLVLSSHSFNMARKGSLGWVPKMSYAQAFNEIVERLMNNAIGTMPVVLGAAALLLALTLAFATRHRPRTDAIPPSTEASGLQNRALWSLVALASLALVYLLMAAYIVKRSQIEHVRHMIFLLPIVFLFIAVCVGMVWKKAPILGLAFVIALCWSQIPLLKHYTSIKKSDFRTVSRFVIDNLEDGSLVLTGGMLNMDSHRYYLELRTAKHLTTQPFIYPEEVAQVCELVQTRSKVGFVSHAVRRHLIENVRNSCGDNLTMDLLEGHNTLGIILKRRDLP